MRSLLFILFICVIAHPTRTATWDEPWNDESDQEDDRVKTRPDYFSHLGLRRFVFNGDEKRCSTDLKL